MQTLFIIALDHAIRIATIIHEEETGLSITQRQRRRHSAVTLLSNTIQEVKMLSQGVEKEANYSPLN